MSIASIGSLTSVYQPQNINTVNGPVNKDSDGDNDGSRVSGTGGRHHGGGAFLQNVIQSLQSFGLSLPGAPVNNTPTTSASGSTSDPVQSTSSSGDARQALHTFLHDLHQALKQPSDGQSSSSATDSDGDHDNSRSSNSGAQNGYSDFKTNLQNLISTLTSNGNTNSGNSTDTASQLQTDFTNLVNALGGSSSTTGPNLQDFLQKLESNLNGSSLSQNGSGVILKTQA